MENLKEIKPIADFNWDEFEKGEVACSASRQEQEAAYDGTLNNVKDQEIVIGTVTKIGKREVLVNIGFKSEGAINSAEFRYNPELQVGDKVEVFIESQEDKKGQLVLSHRQARVARSWDRINEALEKDEVVRGYVKCRTKGGMIVDIFGIEAFLPKVLIEAELEAQKAEIISKLEKGQVLEGVVKNITSYGAFIDLGGIDGLVHITDLSWGRVSHPSEVVSLDQKLNVVILEFDEAKKRIALGIKQLQPHPWDSLDANLKVGDKIKGKVVVLADYGAFIEVAPGVEGLVHISEMSWTQHVRSAQELLKVGDEVEAVILSLDREERKMSLGLKQLKEDPWENIDKRFPIGSRHTAKVRNFTNFGVFVEIEEGIDGLVHISDLSWTKKIKHPNEFTEVGAPLEIVVLEIDKENRRLSLGHKQLEENPWNAFEADYRVGTIHEGTIREFVEKGAVISLPEGIEAFATPKHLVKADGTQAVKGETLPFKVIEFNKDSRRIIVSHSRTFEDEAKAEARASERAERAERQARHQDAAAAVAATNAATEKATLGDLDALAALKEKLS